MKRAFPILPIIAALALAGCNSVNPGVQTAVETACTVVETAAAMPNLPLNGVEAASLAAALAACKATSDGANLTAQTDTTAILSAVVMLEPILANIHIKTAEVRMMRAEIASLHRQARAAGLE